MQISKLKKAITDELTTMESQFGDMDIKELSLVDKSDRLDINYKTASPIDQRKAALDDIKDKIRDAVRHFNEDFEPLTDSEKVSIQSLGCLMLGGASDYELKKPAALQFRHNNSDGFVAGYEKEEMDKFLSEVAAVLVEKDKDVLKTTKKFNDWNDVSNTKIPLNEEIFALLEDRLTPGKLRPAVIVPKMMPAKSLTWTERTEGDALCYDIPAGNFHCCNGAQIKYWKHVNVPSEPAELTKIETTIAELKSEITDLRDDKKLTDTILDEHNAEVDRLKADYDEVRCRLQTAGRTVGYSQKLS